MIQQENLLSPWMEEDNVQMSHPIMEVEAETDYVNNKLLRRIRSQWGWERERVLVAD
jgi:hypothetical protein